MDYIPTKTILSQYTDKNFWFGSNYNMNIYKGCNHGCIYCDSRSECYGLKDFDTVRAKANAIDIIRTELKSKRKKGVVGTGAMSDPYNTFEVKHQLTREALKLIHSNNFGVSLDTKSPLVTRDIDILSEIKEHSPVIIKITITTFDDDLCKKIEPNVAVSSKRFQAIKKLSDNGIFCGVLLMPLLPFINDNEENIRNIIREAAKNGAKFVFTFAMGVTLRQNQRDHYFQQLLKLFPNEPLVKKYIETYGYSYECSSPNNHRLMNVYIEECKKHNLLYKMEDIVSAYKAPYSKEQLTLF